MPAAKFTKDDFDNLEMVRQIVLRRLKEDRRNFNQFYQEWDARTERYVTFDEPRAQVSGRFYMLLDEVLWQLIVQGVITPGKDPSNPTFPWFRLTSHGKKVLEAERFIPHDPTGYLDEVKRVAKSVVGQAALTYLEEALRCFTSGCPLASVLLLGIAAEAVLLRLCEVARNALSDSKEQSNFDQLQWVKAKHRWLVDKYDSLPTQDRRAHLPESLEVTLTSLYELIRRQRNELGHPQEQPPAIDRELAFVYLKLFPSFIKDAEAFATYCENHSL